LVDPGRFILASIALGLLLMVAVVVYSAVEYSMLPDLVAVDFGPGGRPEIGPKEELLTPLAIVNGIGLGVVALISVMTIYRHKIVERYPYLINLPALTLVLGRIADGKRKREYIDRIFVMLALVPLFVAAMLGVVVASILEAAKSMTFDGTFMMASTSVLVAALIAASLLYYRSIYKKIVAEVT